MTLDGFNDLVYENVLKTYELNKHQKIIDGYHKNFWKKCMADIYKGFEQKNNEERLRFMYNELVGMKTHMKDEDFQSCVNIMKNKTEEELFWWLAANDATACYMQFGIT